MVVRLEEPRQIGYNRMKREAGLCRKENLCFPADQEISEDEYETAGTHPDTAAGDPVLYK